MDGAALSDDLSDGRALVDGLVDTLGATPVDGICDGAALLDGSADGTVLADGSAGTLGALLVDGGADAVVAGMLCPVIVTRHSTTTTPMSASSL